MSELNPYASPKSSEKLNSERKVGFWRAFFLGLIAYGIVFCSGVIGIGLVRPFVWSAIYGTPYVSTKEPLNPDSGEWLIVQALACLCAIAAGVAIKHWSPKNSQAALISVIVLFVFLSTFDEAPSKISILRNTLFFSINPLGFLFGAVIYSKISRKR